MVRILDIAGEIRGMHFSENQQLLYVVANEFLYQVDGGGNKSLIGTIDGDSLVSMTDRGASSDVNGNQIVIFR